MILWALISAARVYVARGDPEVSRRHVWDRHHRFSNKQLRRQRFGPLEEVEGQCVGWKHKRF